MGGEKWVVRSGWWEVGRGWFDAKNGPEAYSFKNYGSTGPCPLPIARQGNASVGTAQTGGWGSRRTGMAEWRLSHYSGRQEPPPPGNRTACIL